MNHMISLFTWICLPLLAGSGVPAEEQQVLPLAGEWRFKLDPAGEIKDPGVLELSDGLKLPGSTDQGGFGEETQGPEFEHLTRKWKYVGPAWYERDVAIPEAWQDKEVVLFLERCHWETRVWIDGSPKGARYSLCTPHVYALGRLSPGRHTITIRVDNALIVNIGNMGHAITEHTQSNWNGIIGRIELQAHDPVRIEWVKTFPNVKENKLKVAIGLLNHTGETHSGTVDVQIREKGSRHVVGKASVPFALKQSEGRFNVELSLEQNMRGWVPEAPVLYEAEALLTCGEAGDAFRNSRVTTFGFREVGHDKDRITINDRPVFLRGTLECCIFPKTGYPPTEEAPWERIFSILQAYGLNHMRFHSWCPPEAAFNAADRMGIILHVETPLWIDFWMEEKSPNPKPAGQDAGLVAFIQAELDRILDVYGNHPSFCMLCMGNELAGDYDLLESMINRARDRDPRHLYACSTARRLMPGDDFYVTHRTEKGAVRGILGVGTDWDFSRSLEGVGVPVISHEIGQWVSYPDYSQIAKHTGVLEARSLESFRDVLTERGMAGFAKDFHLASGAFALLLYKEEMEAAQRTPGFGGFQLLDLHDFPGQGEALVGLLDAFWDAKGFVTEKAFRCFCNETVPLLRMSKFVWTADETFEALAQVAHHGAFPLKGIKGVWSMRDTHGIPIALGRFDACDMPPASLTTLGEIRIPLSRITRAAQFKLTVELPGLQAANAWDFWVYPSQVDLTVPEDISVAHRFNGDGGAAEALSQGKKVLLLTASQPPLDALENRFLPVFWSFSMFAAQAGTLGILCDPEHPALAGFPTEMHSNWQWRELAQGSHCYVLDDTSPDFIPIVWVIDDFHRNHKLGAIIETSVGTGKLLACAMDLEKKLDERPAARHLLASLLRYMGSKAFDPKVELEPNLLDTLFKTPEPLPIAAGPKDGSGALLHVKAAALLETRNSNQSWKKDRDSILAQADGFDYEVTGDGTWVDDGGSAWHGARLDVTVTCPKGFTGKLYIHFHDWNELDRRGRIRWGGNTYTLGNHEAEGIWAVFSMTEGATSDGRVQLETERTAGPNLMITEIIVK